jgi:hypothetical protein
MSENIPKLRGTISLLTTGYSILFLEQKQIGHSLEGM